MNPLTIAASVPAHEFGTVDMADGDATKAPVPVTCAGTLWHGGGAQSQRDEVIDMSPEDRVALVRFFGEAVMRALVVTAALLTASQSASA